MNFNEMVTTVVFFSEGPLGRYREGIHVKNLLLAFQNFLSIINKTNSALLLGFMTEIYTRQYFYR